MPDNTDAKAFQSLKKTAPGMRFQIALQEADVALGYIKRMCAAGNEKNLDNWRRNYVQACNNASKAIDQLQRMYQWPRDSQADLDFFWVPAGARTWTWQHA